MGERADVGHAMGWGPDGGPGGTWLSERAQAGAWCKCCQSMGRCPNEARGRPVRLWWGCGKRSARAAGRMGRSQHRNRLVRAARGALRRAPEAGPEATHAGRFWAVWRRPISRQGAGCSGLSRISHVGVGRGLSLGLPPFHPPLACLPLTRAVPGGRRCRYGCACSSSSRADGRNGRRNERNSCMVGLCSRRAPRPPAACSTQPRPETPRRGRSPHPPRTSAPRASTHTPPPPPPCCRLPGVATAPHARGRPCAS